LGAFRQHDFEQLVEDIDRAMHFFESTSNHAIMRIYRKSIFEAEALGHGPSVDHTSNTSLVTDPEDEKVVSQHQNENLFLVYLCV
jgi:hypothetical protein